MLSYISTELSKRADLGRRAFLMCGAVSAATALAPDLLRAQAIAPTPRALDAFTNVLLPGDAVSPSASSLAIADALLSEVEQGSMTERLIGAGTGFLDQVGPRPFADLPPVAQAEFVDWMSSADFNAIPGRFYHVIRLFTVAYYYSHPAVVASFPLNTAPQPWGYPPPWGDA